MAIRTRFALSLLVFAMISSAWLFSQEPNAKKPVSTTTTDQTSSESNARSRKYCEPSDCVQKVLYFSNISQPVDLQDVVNAIRVIAEIQRVQPIIGSQIIVVEGTAEQVAMAERLATEIDKAKRRFGGLGYRIDFRIHETENDKRLHSRLYSFITDDHQTARISLGRQLSGPVKSDSGSETKQTSDTSAAGNIECRIVAVHERTLELTAEASFAVDSTNEPGGAPPPLHRITTRVTLELDKPTVIARIDDPNSDRSYAIELTATRIKEKT